MNVKIKDVAKAASVSVATVSRVINGIPLVNEETKKRVLDAIEVTGYKPNAIARSLKMQKTNTFGIMIPDISKEFYTQVVRGVEDICNIYDYHIILCNTDSNPERELTYLNVFLEKQCDGILYIGKSLNEKLAQALLNCNVDVVLGAVVDDKDRLISVTIDNSKASYDITKLLMDKGHRKIAFLNDEDNKSFVGRERKKGYIMALESENLEVKKEYHFEGKYTIQGGYDLMEEVLNLEERPTAVVALNDEMAFGAIRKLEDKGLKVPDDMSVVGFNDFELSEWSRPSITTIAQPLYDIGAICARMLMKKNGKGSGQSKSMYVPHKLIQRDSVKGL